MARARNIKPGFFTNDDLVELPFEARLLFIGLWTVADRAGRLLDRPKKIRMDIFPADSVDVEECLAGLARLGFVHRYEAAGKKVIQITNWEKHQNPHVKEAVSTLPAAGQTDSLPNPTLDEHHDKSDEHDASTMQVSEIPERAGLIPDSGFRIPDSGLPSTATTPDGVVVASDAGSVQPAKSSKPDCPHQEIIALYHEVLPQCPQVRAWTPARATQLRARWNEDERRQNLEYWRGFFKYVGGVPFLVGGGKGDRPFFADLAWMTKQENFTKIREGRYE